jgi:DNA replication initiation complex subunit (GINS family)
LEELNYEALRRIQQKERSSGILVELPEDFYQTALALVLVMRAGLTDGFSLDRAREYENAIKVLRDIYSLREQKLLMRALKGAKSAEPLGGVSSEEKEMFERVRTVIAECESAFEASLNGAKKREPAPAPAKPAPQGENRALRMLAEVPQFMGVDGKPYGPFKAGETIIVPNRIAELLLKKKVAGE